MTSPLKHYSVLPVRGGVPVVKLVRQYAGFRITTLVPTGLKEHATVVSLYERAEAEFAGAGAGGIASW